MTVEDGVALVVVLDIVNEDVADVDIDDDTPVADVLVEDALELVVLDPPAPLYPYTFSRLEPPQNVDGSPLQAMLQPSDAGAPGDWYELSHQHSCE